MAVDASGNIWVGGTTSSDDFPLRDALQTAIGSPGQSGFLVKLAPDGTVIYSSYFGGIMGFSSLSGVATDQSGNVYVTGPTESSDFPTTPGLPAGRVTTGGAYEVYGAFVTKLDTTGLHIIYSALLAGTAMDCTGSSCLQMPRTTGSVGIAIDGAGNALVAGNTNITDLPVTPGGIPGIQGFVAKINAAGNELAYLTYLGPGAGLVADYGPTETILVNAIAADTAGDAYLTGNTNDPAFPATKGAYQTSLSGTSAQSLVDAFAVKLNPAGTLLWATYLGDAGSDSSANSISLDSSGDVWLTGSNGSGFPVVPPVSETLGEGNFLAELSASGSALLSSLEFAGVGESVAIDPSGVVHVASDTDLVSTITPGQPFASRVAGVVNATGSQQQFSGHVAPGEVISIFGFGLGPTTPVTATPQNGFFPTSLGGVQVLVNGAAIPLLYVSVSQINAELPAPLSDMNSGVMQVINNRAMLPDFRIWVAVSDFGIFGSAINQDGTVNSYLNPAKAGSLVSIWATGLGNAAGPVDGAVAKVANNRCGFCTIAVGGVNETVAYAGAAPGLIDGIMQINFMVPTELGATTGLSLNFKGLGVDGSLYVSQNSEARIQKSEFGGVRLK